MKLNFECMKAIIQYLEENIKFEFPDALTAPSSTEADAYKTTTVDVVDMITSLSKQTEYSVVDIKYAYKNLVELKLVQVSSRVKSLGGIVTDISFEGHKFATAN